MTQCRHCVAPIRFLCPVLFAALNPLFESLPSHYRNARRVQCDHPIVSRVQPNLAIPLLYLFLERVRGRYRQIPVQYHLMVRNQSSGSALPPLHPRTLLL
eukprot:Rmarinus@m.1360